MHTAAAAAWTLVVALHSLFPCIQHVRARTEHTLPNSCYGGPGPFHDGTSRCLLCLQLHLRDLAVLAFKLSLLLAQHIPTVYSIQLQIKWLESSFTLPQDNWPLTPQECHTSVMEVHQSSLIFSIQNSQCFRTPRTALESQ